MNVPKTGAAPASGDDINEADDKDSYTVGWICALPLEMAAAKIMLDEVYNFQIEQDEGDHNTYRLGLMQGHKVVIACLPKGVYGTITAATVAKDMLRTFKSIRFGLMVGVGGGAPSSAHDIRLGDVVVSIPTDVNGGVIQYDRGKTGKDEEFKRTGSLNAPPTVLLTAVGSVETNHSLGESNLPQFLAEAVGKIPKPKIRQQYAYQGESNDCLFHSDYEHANPDASCDDCDRTQTEPRKHREDTDPVVHYGNIASGNQVIKHSKTRDRLSEELEVLCFEMEAAGLMQEFPCLVIRGICDYADSHKNKKWQGYAAATAAAYAKELLSVVSPARVQKEKIVVLDPKLYALVYDLQSDIRNQREEQQIRYADDKNQECLEALSQTDPSLHRDHILDTKGELLRESYSWIINSKQFQDWRIDTKIHHLWIKGDPGKGKTMLLCGLIQELEQEHGLCFFFCQATEERLRTASAVLRGLIFHLAKEHPKLVPHIRKESDNRNKNVFEDKTSWQVLCRIIESMLKDDYLGEMIIIVDALDECVDMTDRHKLLKFLQRISSGYSVKVIISSRNLPDIEKAMVDATIGPFTLALEDRDNRDFVSTAVAAYIERGIESVASRDPYKSDSDVVQKVRDHLTTNAKDTFLWVALVCKELKQPDIEEDYQVVSVLENSPPGLEELYERMFSSVSSSRYSKLSRDILAVTSVLKRSVTLQELRSILSGSPDFNGNLHTLEHAIRSCGSFLNLLSHTVQFVHQSAVDYLKSSAPMLPTIAERHQSVFLNSLVNLSKPGNLKRDIYDLKEPGVALADINHPSPDPLSALRYCCTYWVDHLSDWICGEKTALAKPLLKENHVVARVDNFLRSKFLFWTEALSLLRQIPQALKAIQKLHFLFNQTASSIEQGLSAFISDANRFLLYHRVMIENTPLQLYASALLFAPEESVVKKQFAVEAPDWVKITSGLETTWSACLKTLECHGDYGTYPDAIAYSPDGEWLVARYTDGIVKLWDAETGTCAHTVRAHGEEDKLKSSLRILRCSKSTVAFSADGKSFVSGSWNGVVQVWDKETGRCTHQLEPLSSEVTKMAISSNGYMIASVTRGSNDIIIRSTIEEIPARIVKCHLPNVIRSLALTANGEWIASISAGGLIEVLHISTGERKHISMGYEAWTVAWSPDGEWIASGGDESVQIWERRTGQSIRRMKYEIPNSQNGSPSYMDFSADKRFLAAGCAKDINVWDTTTGNLTWAIYGFYHVTVGSISFSPDAQRIVSASHPSTIQVWDLSIAHDTASQGMHSLSGNLFGADEHYIMIGYDGTQGFKIWSGAGGMPNSISVDYDGCVVAFSQEHQQFASGSGCGTITIRDLKTGDILRHICVVGEHVFSNDEDALVNECGWECENPDVRHLNYMALGSSGRGSAERLVDLTFGNNFQLASCVDGLIKIFNTSNGGLVQTLDSGGRSSPPMSFSSDGRWLAFSFARCNEKDSNCIQVWDIAIKQCISKLAAESMSMSRVASLSFSAAAQHLVCNFSTTSDSSLLTEIGLWEVNSGSLLRRFGSDKVKILEARFDTKLDRRLHTEYGFFDITGLLGASSTETSGANSEISKEDFEIASDSEMLKAMPFFRGYGLSCDHQWIARDGKRLLWIPPDFIFSDHDRWDEVSPVIDGSIFIWARGTRDPVRMYFTEYR